MTLEEAIGTLALAEGKFDVTEEDGVVRVHYTGTDPDEEGRIAQALIIVSQGFAESVGGEIEVRSVQTDNVHLPVSSETADE